MSGGDWVVVVPVKPAAAGKTRLEVPGIDRVALARAIALDTIAAATACDEVGQVIVVSDDAALPLQAAGIPGLRFVSETEPDGSVPLAAATARADGGSRLDAAVAVGIAAAGERPRAALLGDLPALRPDDLAAALRAATAHDRTVVADAEGTGSTLLTAAAGVPWRSSFGDGSFVRHLDLGFVALDLPDASTLRRDVDTAAQLAEARALGLGPRTAALLP